MIFSHSLFNDPISFDEHSLILLIIENHKFLGDLLCDLSNQTRGISGDVCIFKIDKLIDIPKKARLIIDPTSLDINERSNINGLYSKMIKSESFDSFQKISCLVNELQRMVLYEASLISQNVHFEQDISHESIFKLIGLKFDESGNFSNQILDYVQITSVFSGVLIFIFFNISKYCSCEEYGLLLRSLSYLNIPILLIESEFIETHYPTVIIDKDLCEVRFGF